MSFEYYAKWWITTKKHLEDLNAEDEAIRKKGKSIKERNLANDLIGGLYAKYSMLVQEVDTCLDQMAQPQKRMTVRKLMDAATIRLQELSEELRKIDISEYHYIDGSLIELKLIPHDVEILHPALFYPRPIDVEDMWQKLQKGEQIYIPPKLIEPEQSVENIESEPAPENEADVSGKLKATKMEEAKPEETKTEDAKAEEMKREEVKPEETKKEKLKKKRIQFSPETKELSAEEQYELQRKQIISQTVQMIQVAERARQARIYVFEKLRVHLQKKAVVPGQKGPSLDPEVSEKSALQIQKLWRGHTVREFIKRKDEERRLLIGMTEPSWRSKEVFETFEKNLNVRRALRDQRIREYIQANLAEKARVLRVIAPGLMEDIGDEIREWFRQWYLRAKNFDKYPPEEKGGSILVVRGETMTPEEWIEEVERRRRAKVKGKGKDLQKEKEKKMKLEAEKKKKEAEKKKKEAEAKKKKKKKISDFEYEFGDTTSKDLYNLGEKEHKEIWDERNDFENPLERHYMDMITEEKCYEMQIEVRKKVDELMRLELDMLNEALEEDRARARKKKGKKGKGNKGKKGKKGKGKKKKGKKDITGNRLTEDLFQELFDNGIIKTYPKVRLAEYIGDFSYKNWELRNLEFDPPATMLDVRQAIIMNCIIPLGVERVKKPRSVLIAGPPETGKHLLANAIFTETQCVLFDLSPPALAGKYPGKQGMKMLLHLINKMSRLLSPSILFFDGAERTFYKKVPKEERDMDPKRLGNKLFKGIVKTIKPEDRVLVLGITNKPWASQQGKMKKAFERAIIIPRPDYGSVFFFWKSFLTPYHGVDRNFNFTSLATVTVYYTYPRIREAVENVLTPRRIIQLSYKPLLPQELYEYFLAKGIEPTPDKEYKKFIKFYQKYPLGKERKKFNKYADTKRELEAKAKEKANKKGK